MPAAAVAPVEGSACDARLRELLASDLGFHRTDSRTGTHAWHPFPAKFPPQLPAACIEALTDPGDVVLDPMAGSGTTLVEARRLGRRAIGCDIDPLARLIAAVKLAPVPAADAMAAGLDVLQGARRASDSALAAALERRFDAKTRAFADYWFARPQQLELQALRSGIEALADRRMRDFLSVVLSSTIIAKSGGVSLARDLAHTRPHRVMDKQPKSAFAEFERKLRSNLASPTGSAAPAGEVRAAPASRTGLPDASVRLVVTSPPYANNAIDYMRAHKFSLVWLGWPIDELTGIRKRYIGHDALGTETHARLPTRCEATLARLGAADPRKAAVLRRYFGEMRAVVAEMRRVLEPGGAAVVVVGTSVLRGIDVETHRGLAAIGEQQGLSLAGIGVRRLDRDKRMMPARWGGERRSRIEERMHEEYVIGLVKP